MKNKQNKQSTELLILSQFRRNARENLTTTSKKIRIPISTLYDKLKKYEGDVITRHTSLLDFTKLGFGIRVFQFLKVSNANKGALSLFLKNHSRVNSMFAISGGFDFMIELILKNVTELNSFTESLEKYSICEKMEFFMMDEIKREDFLSNLPFVDPSLPFVNLQKLPVTQMEEE